MKYFKTKKSHLILTIIGIMFNSLSAHAQVTIGSSNPPDKNALLDLKESKDGESTKGLLLPRVALVSENDPTPLQEHIEGMYVYNTTTNDEVVPGNYFNDGIRWNKVKNSQNDPWYGVLTHVGASTIDEDMYHMGAVGVGSATIDPSAQMEVSSRAKGMLLPRLSTIARDAIASPADGLLIYNTTTNCLNTYSSILQKWVSMCGADEPSVYDLLSCDSPTGPQGVYTEGGILTSLNNYTIKVNVAVTGPYDIVGLTTNGYSFSKSGVFNSLGIHHIVLEGQGTPAHAGQDELTLYFNGAKVEARCVLPKITVKSVATKFTIDCSSIKVYGEYATRRYLDYTNYIEVDINVVNPGNALIETEIFNGISFSSNAISLDQTGKKTIVLRGRGMPLHTGVFSGNIFRVAGANCSPTIKVISNRGSYEDPANTCQEIMDENENAEDGYYWIRDGYNKAYKTYCDMDINGAWTLVKSLSERQILVIERSQKESIGTQNQRGLVTTKEGVFNEYAFSLSAATVNNIGITNNGFGGNKLFRFTIKEKGHTLMNRSREAVESTTVSPSDDKWAQNNHWIVTIRKGNPATGNYRGGDSDASYGKLFGLSFGKPTFSSNRNYQLGDQPYNNTPPGMTSHANFFTGFYGHVGYGAGRGTLQFTYELEDGRRPVFTFDRSDVNDLFGIYMGTERQLNHHIGTCSNSTDDYGGAGQCKAGWSNWRAHRFNKRPDGDYEGRIIQYWVK